MQVLQQAQPRQPAEGLFQIASPGPCALCSTMGKARETAAVAAPSPTAEAVKDTRTLFVRGISFDVDEKPLEELFSNVGPVKACFLIRTKGEDKHKGHGFITYALPEDAQRAIEELNGNTALGGRKLMIELANKRAPLEQRKRKKPTEDAPDGEEEAAPTEAAAADPPAKQGKVREAKPPRGAKEQPPAATAAAAKPPATPAAKPPAAAAAAKPAAAAAAAKAPAAAAAAAAARPAAGKPAATAKPTAAAAKPAAAAKQRPAAAAAADPLPTHSQTKHRHMCTVALGNLTAEVTPAALQLARKAGSLEEVADPAPGDVVEKMRLRADGCGGSVVLLVYKTVQEATHAVTQLHGKKLTATGSAEGKKKGKKNKATDEQPAAEEGAVPAVPVPPCVLWARQLSGEGAHVRKWRVIVRNLPFKVSEAVLRKALEAAGFVWELSLPRGPDGRIKGFAFVAYTTRAHAEKAVKTLNGMEVGGRPVAIDWAVAKNQYESGSKVSGDGAPPPLGHSDDPDEDTHPKSEDPDQAAVGGDGYLLEKESEGMSDDEGEEGEGESEEEGEEKSEEESEVERRMLHDVMAGLIVEDEEMEPLPTTANHQPTKQPTATKQPPQAAPKVDKKGAKPEAGAGVVGQTGAEGEVGKTQPAGPPVVRESGAVLRTVFVRSLPLDVTRITLQAKMEGYGRVKACRVVIDKVSGKPKGTAFVEYEDKGGAQKAADACARGRAGKGPGVALSGRLLDVDLAVTQDQARQIAVIKAGGTTKDKRNLYLAKEGEIKQGTPAWNGMSDHDKDKRTRAQEEKKTKLKSPNFLISPTRLSIRNIPYALTEAQLRALAVKAVKERASKEKPSVIQVKILREEAGGKTGPDGKPRSKGMGFVEFSEHDHAVACLRQLNNNPTAFNKDRRPIVEFAIDNVKVLKKLEAIQARRVAGNTNAAAAAGRGGSGADGCQPEEALGPRERKKLKAKAKTERRKMRKLEAAGVAGAAGAAGAAGVAGAADAAGAAGAEAGVGAAGARAVGKRAARAEKRRAGADQQAAGTQAAEPSAEAEGEAGQQGPGQPKEKKVKRGRSRDEPSAGDADQAGDGGAAAAGGSGRADAQQANGQAKAQQANGQAKAQPANGQAKAQPADGQGKEKKGRAQREKKARERKQQKAREGGQGEEQGDQQAGRVAVAAAAAPTGRQGPGERPPKPGKQTPAGGSEGGVVVGQRQSKRRRDDEMMDQAMDEAFTDAYAGSGRVDKRKRGDEQRMDRSDVLAQQYQRKLEGGKRGEASAPAPALRGAVPKGRPGAKAAAGRAPTAKPAGAAKAGKAAGAGKPKGQAAAPAAVQLNLGGAELRRWFD